VTETKKLYPNPETNDCYQRLSIRYSL